MSSHCPLIPFPLLDVLLLDWLPRASKAKSAQRSVLSVEREAAALS